MGSIYPTYRHLNQVEQGIHKRVCYYLRKEYPGIMFRTDGAGLHLSKSQAGIFKSMQSGPGWPDLFIPVSKRGYHGLFLELKQEGTAIYLKIGPRKGKLVANEHIQQQAAVLEDLNKAGYFARFCVGEEKAKQLIDWYMEKPVNTTIF